MSPSEHIAGGVVAHSSGNSSGDLTPFEKGHLLKAVSLWNEASSPKNSPAEAHLLRQGIILKRWPEDVRYHHGMGMLFVKMRTTGGKAIGIYGFTLPQNAEASSADCESFVQEHNLTIGQGVKAVEFRDPSYRGPVVVTDNIVTGFALWAATGREILVLTNGFNSLGALNYCLGRTMVLAARDDRRNIIADSSGVDAKIWRMSELKRDVRLLRRNGTDVRVAEPFTPRRFDGSGFETAFRQYGPGYVAARVDAAITGFRYPARSQALTLHHGREILNQTIQSAFDQHQQSDNSAWFQKGIRIDVGVGKTTAVINQIVKMAIDPNAFLGGPVVYFVPTLALAEELRTKLCKALAEANKHDVRVAVRRGYKAQNPEAVGDQRMCRRTENLDVAFSALASVGKTMCDNGISQCPFYGTCLYQAQKLTEADVWILPHATMFRPRDSFIPTPQLVIIDESFWQGSIEDSKFDCSALSVQPVVRTMNDMAGIVLNINASAKLVELLYPMREKLIKALAANGLGAVQVRCLVEAEVTADECYAAAQYELSRIVRVPETLDLIGHLEEFDPVMRRLGDLNRDIKSLSTTWKILGDYLSESEAASEQGTPKDFANSGRLNVALDRWAKPQMLLSHPRPIYEDWSANTIHMDATLRGELVKGLMPNLEIVADIAVESPNQRVIAVVGKSHSHSALRDPIADDGDGDDNVKDLPKFQGLIDRIIARAAQTRGDVLVIVPKFIEEAISNHNLKLPSHIHVMHHGAIAGIDKYGNVSLCIVAGRQMPAPKEIERIAGVLSGFAVSNSLDQLGVSGNWYPSRWVNAIAHNESAAAIEAAYHPDEFCEVLRQAISDDQIIQAIGRARGVNRTENNKVIVENWNDDLPPFQPDAFISYKPTSIEETSLGLGVTSQNTRHQATLHPEWKNSGAVRQTRYRNGKKAQDLPTAEKGTRFASALNVLQDGRSVTFPYKNNYTIGNVTLLGLNVERYQNRDLNGGLPDLTEVHPNLAAIMGPGIGARLVDPVAMLRQSCRDDKILKHVDETTWAIWLESDQREGTGHLEAALYKLEGAGQKLTVAVADLRVVPALKDHLEAFLGKLAQFTKISDQMLSKVAGLGGPLPEPMTEDEEKRYIAEFRKVIAEI